MKFLEYSQSNSGSSFVSPAHGWCGARVTILSFFLSAPPSEKIAGGFQQAGKKEGGLGEGIFDRLLSAPKARQCVAKRFRRLGIKTSKQNNFLSIFYRPPAKFFLKRIENCFALLAEFRRAETQSGANQAFFVQKRFELRSVIATNETNHHRFRNWHYQKKTPRALFFTWNKKPKTSLWLRLGAAQRALPGGGT